MSENMRQLCVLYTFVGLFGGIGLVSHLWPERSYKPDEDELEQRRIAAWCTLFLPVVCALFPVGAVLALLIMLGQTVAKLILIAVGEEK